MDATHLDPPDVVGFSRRGGAREKWRRWRVAGATREGASEGAFSHCAVGRLTTRVDRKGLGWVESKPRRSQIHFRRGWRGLALESMYRILSISSLIVTNRDFDIKKIHSTAFLNSYLNIAIIYS